MNTNDHGREARSRANRRLRKLTIGTAVFGVVATGGLSALAAVTYDGSGASTAAVATTTSGTTSSTTSATTAATTTAITTNTTTVAATAAPVVTTASGTGHASTGGS